MSARMCSEPCVVDSPPPAANSRLVGTSTSAAVPPAPASAWQYTSTPTDRGRHLCRHCLTWICQNILNMYTHARVFPLCPRTKHVDFWEDVCMVLCSRFPTARRKQQASGKAKHRLPQTLPSISRRQPQTGSNVSDTALPVGLRFDSPPPAVNSRPVGRLTIAAAPPTLTAAHSIPHRPP